MTTTAHEDQFTSEPEHVAHRPYDTAAILRQNVADLELQVQKQRERHAAATARLRDQIERVTSEWERAEAALASAREDLQSWIDSRNGWMERAHAAEVELKAAREQEPALFVSFCDDDTIRFWSTDRPKKSRFPIREFYNRPIPAPAVPDITDEALREEMNGAVIVATDADGVTDGAKVIRGFAKRVLMTWGNQDGMYKAFRDAVTAPAVPYGVDQEAANRISLAVYDWEKGINPEPLLYAINRILATEAHPLSEEGQRALLQSAGGGK